MVNLEKLAVFLDLLFLKRIENRLKSVLKCQSFLKCGHQKSANDLFLVHLYQEGEAGVFFERKTRKIHTCMVEYYYNVQNDKKPSLRSKFSEPTYYSYVHRDSKVSAVQVLLK